MGIYKPKKKPPAKCTHPKGHIEIHKNRKGKLFRECNLCNAFLGWV